MSSDLKTFLLREHIGHGSTTWSVTVLGLPRGYGRNSVTGVVPIDDKTEN